MTRPPFIRRGPRALAARLKALALHVLLVAGITFTCLRFGLWDQSITLMRMLP
ncbi:MAG: hypothetical protein MI785_15030 [Kiloniellales bacterium]|nr:hypothetical protein [Kiloniellales bacterium]